jgi:hypothetical protein
MVPESESVSGQCSWDLMTDIERDFEYEVYLIPWPTGVTDYSIYQHIAVIAPPLSSWIINSEVYSLNGSVIAVTDGSCNSGFCGPLMFILELEHNIVYDFALVLQVRTRGLIDPVPMNTNWQQ